MENVAKMTTAGTLPRDNDDRSVRPSETETSDSAPRVLPAVITVDPNDTYDPDKPMEHVRSPELRRHGTKLLMAVSAVIGAAAGARLLFGDAASETLSASVSRMLTGTFAEVFLRQMLLGALFLAAEFVLGFFALGDLAVWAAPFLYGAGTVLRLAASSPKLIPGALIGLVGVVAGAACSADMSVLLLRLTRGGTVYMDTRPRRSYAIAFAGCLAAVALGAMLTGILMTV